MCSAKSFAEDGRVAGRNGERRFDVVTSNPPYFAKEALFRQKGRESFVRHETTADLDGFLQAAAKILKRRGQLFMVHRPSRLVDIFESCRRCRLEPKTIRFVVPEAGQAPNIVLIHCVLGGGRELKYLPQLAVYDGRRLQPGRSEIMNGSSTRGQWIL